MLMIERIAMSIHDSELQLSGTGEIPAWTAIPDERKAPYRVTAVRVLGAMRGPTHQMLADGNLPGAPADAGNVWERMIFRALYEEND